MKQELDEQLYREFPQLYWRSSLGLSPGQPSSSPCLGGFDCGDGWFPLLYKLSSQLAPIVDKANTPLDSSDDYKFVVHQVKEKFGGLRFYIGGVPEEYYEQVHSLIREAEQQSYHTCETCGQPGKLRQDLGWWLTLCDDHYESARDKRSKKGMS